MLNSSKIYISLEIIVAAAVIIAAEFSRWVSERDFVPVGLCIAIASYRCRWHYLLSFREKKMVK